MESPGRSQCIQITRSTYELIKDEFDCGPLGPIDVKGTSRAEVWRVIGRKAIRLAAPEQPNCDFSDTTNKLLRFAGIVSSPKSKNISLYRNSDLRY